MQFEWDENKAFAHLQKHNIDFADAASVLSLDVNAITRFDRHPDEDRYVTIGLDSLGRLLVVVYTLRGNRVRIISARRAIKTERQLYRE